MICPYKFSRLHRGGWTMCMSLFSMALCSAVIGYETTEERCAMIILCLQVYVGMLLVVELLAWWIRKWWLDGIFQSFTVDVRMSSMQEEDARDVMYNMAVWPVIKAQNKKREWFVDSVNTIMRLFYFGCVVAMIAVFFA